MSLVRTVWRGSIDGVKYRLVSANLAESRSDALVVSRLQALSEVTYPDNLQSLEDSVIDRVRWRSEEELGFSD